MADDSRDKIQVKICGITRVADALDCLKYGADGIGFIFYPPSSRFVRAEKAAEIAAALPDDFPKVGVFVNETFNTIMKMIESTGINVVQLHGEEEPELAQKLKKTGIKVVKALFVNKEPGLEKTSEYDVDGILVESPGGRERGGTGTPWDWSRVKNFKRDKPLVLAGGLSVENVTEAIEIVKPDVLDVSSGVESAKGIKDGEKIKKFMEAVRSASSSYGKRSLF